MSEYEGHKEMDALEALIALAGIAKMLRGYYVSLTDEGFTEIEALALTVGYQAALAGNAQS